MQTMTQKAARLVEILLTVFMMKIKDFTDKFVETKEIIKQLDDEGKKRGQADVDALYAETLRQRQAQGN